MSSKKVRKIKKEKYYVHSFSRQVEFQSKNSRKYRNDEFNFPQNIFKCNNSWQTKLSTKTKNTSNAFQVFLQKQTREKETEIFFADYCKNFLVKK